MLRVTVPNEHVQVSLRYPGKPIVSSGIISSIDVPFPPLGVDGVLSGRLLLQSNFMESIGLQQ